MRCGKIIFDFFQNMVETQYGLREFLFGNLVQVEPNTKLTRAHVRDVIDFVGQLQQGGGSMQTQGDVLIAGDPYFVASNDQIFLYNREGRLDTGATGLVLRHPRDGLLFLPGESKEAMAPVTRQQKLKGLFTLLAGKLRKSE